MYVSQSRHDRFSGAILTLFCSFENIAITAVNGSISYSFIHSSSVTALSWSWFFWIKVFSSGDTGFKEGIYPDWYASLLQDSTQHTPVHTLGQFDIDSPPASMFLRSGRQPGGRARHSWGKTCETPNRAHD